MKIVDEFKQFAMRGNVIDLAVGVIIGGAFGKIITSFVNDVLMPPIGLLLGGLNFTDFKIVLKPGADKMQAVTLNYGNFIQVTVDFLIVAAVIFLMVKMINSLQKKQDEKKAAPEPSQQEKLLSEIRDILKSKK
jgi:large conductance mechanosensitive channel